MKRRSEFDVARGLMLVLMTLTHVPTQFAQLAGQPFGYVSAAEGFVLLSAFMAGMVYTGKALKGGLPAMQRALVLRAATVYVCQAALLVFLFSVVAALGIRASRPAITDMISFYLNQPLTALFSGFALVYNPPLLDILPLYVVLLLVTPFALAHALRRGWTVLFAVSLVLWFATQFGLGQWLYEHVAVPAGFPVPYREMGSFETLGWQLVWLIGLWMGVRTAHAGANANGDVNGSSVGSGVGSGVGSSVGSAVGNISGRLDGAGSAAVPVFGAFPRWAVRAAWGYALLCFCWRHVQGQLAMPDPNHLLNMEFDKWSVGPLRLLNFLALLLLAIQHGPALLARLPRQRWLELLGTASLPVFCAQLVVVLLALLAVGPPDPQRPVWIDVLLLAATFVLLTLTAFASRALDRRVQALHERRAVKRSAPRAASANAGD